jgi:hypothetical protein
MVWCLINEAKGQLYLHVWYMRFSRRWSFVLWSLLPHPLVLYVNTKLRRINLSLFCTAFIFRTSEPSWETGIVQFGSLLTLKIQTGCSSNTLVLRPTRRCSLRLLCWISPLACSHSKLILNYEPYRQLVGLLGRGISAFSRPLPTQGNTVAEKSQTYIHLWKWDSNPRSPVL